jgi:hypothetical protein
MAAALISSFRFISQRHVSTPANQSHQLRSAALFALILNEILVFLFVRNFHRVLTHNAGKEIDERASVVVGNAHFRNYRSDPTR